MRGLNGRNGQLLKAVDTARVSLEKNPQHSCKASECCLVTDIRALPVGKQEWVEISKNRSTERANCRFFFFQIWMLKSTQEISGEWCRHAVFLSNAQHLGFVVFRDRFIAQDEGKVLQNPLHKKNVFVYDLIHYDFYYTAEWEVITVEILERWKVTKCCLNIIDKTWIAFQERKVVTLEIL